MMFKLCYIITEVLLYFVTLDWITLGRIKRKRGVSLTCGAILVAMEMILIKNIGEEDAVGKTIFVMLCLVWMFIYLCVTDHSQGLLYKFSMTIATVVIDTIYAVLLTLPSSYLCLWIAGNRNMKVVRIFFMVVYIITSVLIEHHGQKLPLYKVFDNRGIRFITTAVGICIIVLQQIGFHLAQSQYRNLSILIANFLIFTIIIGILWLLDHYRLAAGKLKVEQDNRRMNTSLHKTKELMPLAISLAHKLCMKLTDVRKEKVLQYLRPDGKAQVTVEYVDGKPKRIDAVVLSTQHAPTVTLEQIRSDLMHYVITPVLPAEMLDENTKYYINPTGRFVVGGPQGDSGLTGRKIIVDTYGGSARHGGGAFSGKDPTKVDRSAAYAARYIAKNIVAADLADRCEVQLAYAIGVAHPVSVLVDTFGTGKVDEEKLSAAVQKVFSLTPDGIIEMLQLRKPQYRKLAAYGHMGREDLGVAWEKCDRVEALKQAVAE